MKIASCRWQLLKVSGDPLLVKHALCWEIKWLGDQVDEPATERFQTVYTQ